MTVRKALMIVALWQSRRFDTLDIAEELDVHEADVCRVIGAARDAELGPRLVVVK